MTTRLRWVTWGAAVLIAAGVVPPLSAHSAQAGESRPRVVLMDDPELDDQNTVIRYLLYSDQFDTEGLMYSSSGVHWAGDGKGTEWFVPGREYRRFGLNLCPCTSWRWKPGERFINDAVDLYARVYPNLRVHSRGFPSPEALKAKVFVGNIQFDGDISRDSSGSKVIERLLLDDRPGPLYLLTGAGHSTIARALKAIELRYQGTAEWPAIKQKISRKAIINSFADQDGTYASYIQPHWPGIVHHDMRTVNWGYGARSVVLPQYAHYLTAAWMKPNVSDIGPLGAFYRVWGDGRPPMGGPADHFDYFGLAGLSVEQLEAMGFIVFAPPQEKGSWISEGDSSIYMNLIDNGLRAGEDPTYGGWGGRAGIDHDNSGATPPDYAAARWFGPAEDDFAARLKWTIAPHYRDANHAPVVRIRGRLDRIAHPGERVALKASVSDPDGNELQLRWWQYRDAGTYPGSIAIQQENGDSASFEVPADAAPGQTIHVILQVKDDGQPPMTRYGRVIVSVQSRVH